MRGFSIGNRLTIRQREDGYISLTDMAQACGKRLDNRLRLDSTKEYLTVLKEEHSLRSEGIPVAGIPVTELPQM